MFFVTGPIDYFVFVCVCVFFPFNLFSFVVVFIKSILKSLVILAV